ncbi:heavy-metal-associated domain-containing protein [Flavobacteriaceae bacterium]|jgi:copper chaperone|nr:heavy-metal-associated domain-containing protein [Flavobacteriaceae bacterium]
MTTTLEIQNLKCGGCAHTIISKLNNLEGTQNVSVDTNSNTVSFENELASEVESATKLLSKLGYPVNGDVNSIGKKAKSFVSCAVGRMAKP